MSEMRLYKPAGHDRDARSPTCRSGNRLSSGRASRPARASRANGALPSVAGQAPRARPALHRASRCSTRTRPSRSTRCKRGEDIVVVTPTASGKSLCFNLPVLQSVADDPAARALYLFPTKALSQDQLAAFRELADAAGDRRRGGRLRRRHAQPDQAQHPRRGPGRRHQPGHAPLGDPAPSHQVVPALRAAALHRHRRDAQLSRHLRQPCRERAPTFASAVRPLRQSKPQIICCSATIGNPRELAEMLTGRHDDGHRPQRCASRREARGDPQSAGHRPAPGHQAGAARPVAQGGARRSCAPDGRRSCSPRHASRSSCC